MPTFRVKMNGSSAEDFEAFSYDVGPSGLLELQQADGTITTSVASHAWTYITRIDPDPFTIATKQAALSP